MAIRNGIVTVGKTKHWCKCCKVPREPSALSHSCHPSGSNPFGRGSEKRHSRYTLGVTARGANRVPPQLPRPQANASRNSLAARTQLLICFAIQRRTPTRLAGTSR